MRQRVVIALAMAMTRRDYRDEPTTALDVTVQAVSNAGNGARADRAAMILITHDLGVIAGQPTASLSLRR